MIPRVDPPREARLLICQAESPSEQEYGDRMDALEAEERLSRHHDLSSWPSSDLSLAVERHAPRDLPVPVAGPAHSAPGASAHPLPDGFFAALACVGVGLVCVGLPLLSASLGVGT